MKHAELIGSSKFMSYVLRHQPETFNLKLDKEGWLSIDDLIKSSEQHNFYLTKDKINYIVNKCKKQRFQISEDKNLIRAVQGHSNSEVDIKFSSNFELPAIVYHGTTIEHLPLIKKEGLKKMSRQYVHLSFDEKTALKVGKRHGEPIILKIDSKKMKQEGFIFYLSENNVILTDNVPVDFISL